MKMTPSSGQKNLDHLTKSELRIINLIAEGKSSKEIAAILSISLRTVEKHRSNIIFKLNLSKDTNSLTKWVLLNVNDR